MPRTPRAGTHEASHRIRAWRQFRGLTLEKLAESIGMTPQNLGRIERALVPLSEEHLPALARALMIDVPDLFSEPNGRKREMLVPIIGRVGADTEGVVIHTDSDLGQDMVPIPPGGSPHSRALEVVGHSMRDIAEEGSIIYFEDQRTPPTEEMIRYYVIAQLEDGRVLFKRLLRGSRPGLFTLESQLGPAIEDVRIVWAAEPIAIIPPKQARRTIVRADERQAL